MPFSVTIGNNTTTYQKKMSLLEILNGSNEDKSIIAARGNNRVRELTYEVNYDCEIQWLTVKDGDATKTYEASLRFITAMAFRRAYPDLKIRFAYNVSRCVSIHLLTPGYTANTAMLLKVSHEMERIIEADYPLKRMVVPIEKAREVYGQLGDEDKLALLPYRPEKTAHLYECDGFYDYMYSHMVPSTLSLIHI